MSCRVIKVGNWCARHCIILFHDEYRLPPVRKSPLPHIPHNNETPTFPLLPLCDGCSYQPESDKWAGARNIDVIGFETAGSVTDASKAWNMVREGDRGEGGRAGGR